MNPYAKFVYTKFKSLAFVGGTDIVCFSPDLFMRLTKWARDSHVDDATLKDVTQRCQTLGENRKALDASDFSAIVGNFDNPQRR